MKIAFLSVLALSALCASGCAEEITGPPLSLDPSVAPATVCNASDGENQALQTRVVFRATSGSSFAPLPIDTFTPDASLAIPRVTLRSADGREVAVRQVEFVSAREMALWVTRSTGGSGALAPGSYTVSVTNPDGQGALTMTGSLRVVPPPTVASASRLDPTVPTTGVDADEAQTVCNAAVTTLTVTGTGFRPMDPTPVVEVIDARGAVVRRVADRDIRVTSERELRVTLQAPMDPALRLAPGRYGFRVTNPDGTSSTGAPSGDAGVSSGDAGADLTGTQYPQGCHSTAPSLFNVVPPPEVRSVAPVSACSSREQRFIVRGAHFRHGLTATIAAMTPFEVPASNIVYASSTGSTNDFDTLTLTVPASAVAPGGGYALAIRNADSCGTALMPQCPEGTSPTGADNECQGTVGMASGTGPRSITYYADPVVTSIMPRGVCTARLVPVTLTGMNFHSTYGVQPTVRIHDVALENVRVTSPTTITADIPMTLMAGAPLGTPYDVSVTVPEGCAGNLPRGFTLFPPVTASSVSPGAVCVDRPGTTLTVTGTNFHSFEGVGPTVTLGSTPPTALTNVRVVSPTTLTADLPMATPPGGPYDVTVTSPVGCGATVSRAFTYYAAPTVTAAVAQASCTGGNPVLVITGTNLHATGATQPTVTLDTPTPTALTNVRATSDTTVLAELPLSLPMGSYTARVTMPEGCAASSAPFVYNPGALVTPTLAGMIPSRGWNGIDMPVTIVGTGLATLTSLSLRGAGAAGGDLALTDISVVGSDLLNATIPSGGRAGGPYDLVSTVAGCPLTLPRAYTISDAPAITITGVTPPFGWTGGSTPILLQGTGFVSTPRLYIIVPSLTPRMRPLSRPVFINPNSVSAVVPSDLPPGTYDLAAINPDGGGGVIRGAFRVTMLPPPTINTVTPGAGTTQSPTPVTITGASFRASQVTLRSSAGASFNGTVTAATATSLSVTLPTNTMATGAYIVRVNNPDESTFADFGSFVVTNPSVKLGPFASASALTTARRGAAVLASQVNSVTRFLHAIGGDSGAGGTTHASVEFASVDLFGRLGPWRLQRYRLPSPLTGVATSAIERGGFLYVLGGANGSGAPQSTVLRARVLDFSTAPVIADPEITRTSSAGLAAGAWIYRVSAVMGATDAVNPGGETLPSDEVTAYFVFGSTVRLRWNPIPGAASYRVYRTPTVNGASGSEVLLSTTPSSATTFVDDASATPSATGLETQPLAVGSTGVWAPLTTALTTARATTAAAIAPDPSGNLFVYALTGRGASGPLATYEYASLSADGSTLGAFTAGPSPFPTARELAASAVATPQSAPSVSSAVYVYVTGGFGTGGSLRTTESARVSSGGALMSPADTNSYAMRRGALSSMIVNGEFYAMGGTSGMNPTSSALDSTNLSTLASSGTPGSFSNASVSMITGRQNFGLALASAYFFLVGGTSSGTNALTSVEQTIY
jgi:hypothetical protein